MDCNYKFCKKNEYKMFYENLKKVFGSFPIMLFMYINNKIIL